MAPYKTALVIPMSYEKVWTPEGREKVGFPEWFCREGYEVVSFSYPFSAYLWS